MQTHTHTLYIPNGPTLEGTHLAELGIGDSSDWIRGLDLSSHYLGCEICQSNHSLDLTGRTQTTVLAENQIICTNFVV